MKTLKIYERIDVETFIANSPFNKSNYSNDYLKSCGLQGDTSEFDKPHNQLAIGHFVDRANQEDLAKLKQGFIDYIARQEKEIAEQESKLRTLKLRLSETKDNQALISKCNTYKRAFEVLCTNS